MQATEPAASQGVMCATHARGDVGWIGCRRCGGDLGASCGLPRRLLLMPRSCACGTQQAINDWVRVARNDSTTRRPPRGSPQGGPLGRGSHSRLYCGSKYFVSRRASQIVKTMRTSYFVLCTQRRDRFDCADSLVAHRHDSSGRTNPVNSGTTAPGSRSLEPTQDKDQ